MCRSRKCMPFAIPRIWREPTNHHDNYHFCMVDISKYKKTKDRKRLFIQVYLHPLRLSTMAQNCLFLNLQLRMLYHQPHRKMTMLILRLTQIVPAIPHFPNQDELDDFSRDLGLTKAEILSSRVKEWNLLAPSCKISKPRKRHVTFANFYTMSSDSDHPSLCYCTSIQGLFLGDWNCVLSFGLAFIY